MLITLRDFQLDDLINYTDMLDEINASQYMSRFYPKEFDGKQINRENYTWFAIEFDGELIGSFWLETNSSESTIATLGIAIGKDDKLDKGIGTEAIKIALSKSKELLNYEIVDLNVRVTNQRAIACYKKCGFVIDGDGIKVNDKGEEIKYYHMVLNILEDNIESDNL